MSIHRVLAAASKDLARRLQDPWALVSWLAAPFLVGALITLLTGGGSDGPSPKASLLVADLDQSLLSGMLTGALGQGELGEMISTEAVELEDGQRRMEDGKASGLLVIPEGFGAAALREQPSTLRLVTNPSQSVAPQLLEQVLDVLLDAGFFAQRIFGEELRAIAEGDASDEVQFAVVAMGIQKKINRLAPALEDVPTIVEPAPEPQDDDSAPRPGFALLLFPGVVTMAVFMTALGLAGDLWRERELGTLRRLATTAGGVGAFLPGKLLSGSVVTAGIASVLLLCGFAYHGLPWARLPAAVIFLSLGGATLFLGLALLQVLVKNRRSGEIFGQLLLFPLLMVGGSFFPLEALPDSLAAIGALTPNGWITEGLKAYLLEGALPALLTAALPLLLISAVLALAVHFRITRHFAAAVD